MAKKLLILGGTTEAAALARRTVDSLGGEVEVISSLAGRVKARGALPGTVRVGGFGGAEGLARYIEDAGIDWLIDATHPFSPTISANAAAAAASARIPRLVLTRPPWHPPTGARWTEAADLGDAARLLRGAGERVFLTIGARGLDAFAGLADTWFLVRVIEQPEHPPPLAHHTVTAGRPPHAIEDERRLLADHRIDTLVTRQSGGRATEAKIVAAAEAGVHIIAIRRPPPEPGAAAATPDEALAWLRRHLPGAGN